MKQTHKTYMVLVSSGIKMIKKFALILIALLCLINCKEQTRINTNIEKRIDSLFTKYNTQTPGVAIGVVKNGKLIFKKGYGSSTLEYNIPITPTTVFPIASVSKQFTAFAIYLLENDGKLSLEDDIRKYIPNLPDYGTTIKIKHLLAHTSGLRDQFAILTLAGWRMDDVISTMQVMKLALQQKGLNFEPGTALGYSNTGYTFLAQIVEKITGKSLAEYTKEHIFDPLEMINTQFYDNYRKPVKNRAYSYEKGKTGYLKQNKSFSAVGGAGLYTTVEDLAKWVINFEKPIVGNNELLNRFNKYSRLNNDEKTVIRVMKDGDTLFHAKGQFRRKYRGLNLLSHGGHLVGFRTFLGRFPDENLSIIALSNDEDYDIMKKNYGIADFFLNGELESKKENVTTNEVQSNNSLPEAFKTDLKEFVGEYYSDELTTSYKVVVQDGELVMQHRKLSDFKLTRTGENEFSGVNYFYFQLKFIKNKNKVTGFVISNFGAKNIEFNKVFS